MGTEPDPRPDERPDAVPAERPDERPDAEFDDPTEANAFPASPAVSPALSRPAEPDFDSARPTDARLARLHVRAGLFSLARAELEAFAGRASLDDGAPLDTDTLLDLAEVRWRTGDLAGAGEAAAAYLDAGGTTALGYVIAAEATSALGRPGEARRLAGQALERMDVPIDALFAGIPRSSVWPTDPADPGEPVAPFFPAAGQSIARPARSRPTRAVVTGGAGRGAERDAGLGRGGESVDDDRVRTIGRAAAADTNSTPGAGLGLWDATDAQAASASAPLDANRELAAARNALAAGRMDEAAVRLAVALRIGPSLAPAVLDAAAGAAGPSFELIRGDAYRLVGHEIEARRSYAAAAASARERAGSAPTRAASRTTDLDRRSNLDVPGDPPEDDGEAGEAANAGEAPSSDAVMEADRASDG